LMVMEFGHGTLPLRSNAEDCGSVPSNCECGQVDLVFRRYWSKSHGMRILIGYRVVWDGKTCCAGRDVALPCWLWCS
jgi:hypothetical protein